MFCFVGDNILFSRLLDAVHSYVWGTGLIFLIFLTGAVILIKTEGFPLRKALRIFSRREKTSKDGPSAFQSASTALCATMGTGNIVGVAGAVALGGAGVVFWMWVSALFSMAVKFAEITLSVHYRQRDKNGSFLGGMMYCIKNGLPSVFLPLAYIAAFCGLVSSFGTGNLTQTNTAVLNVYRFVREIIPYQHNPLAFKLILGVFCAGLVGAVLFKGETAIGRFCEKLFPFMTVAYLILCFAVLIVCRKNIPTVFAQIFRGAFRPETATLGVVTSVPFVIKTGVSRGMFSNEAGLGTAPIAYSCADGKPCDLGLWGVFEVFVDTVLVCTLTAVTVLCATEISYGVDAPDITLFAFSNILGRKALLVFCPVLCFFAFSSIIGWGLYGTRFAAFLFGENAKKPFLAVFCLFCVIGAVAKAQTVWEISETLNGVMAWIGCTVILLLSNKIKECCE